MNDLLRDLRWAVRSLGRTPLFTAVAVLTLALGIGVNASIFTVVNTVLLRPLPVERPDELVHVYSSWEDEPFATSSYPDYVDLRDGVDALSGLVGHASAIATLQHQGRSEIVVGELVSGNAFEVLGVPVARGRGLLPEDDAGPGLDAGAPRVVVLGHGLWTRRFGADPAILGRTVRFDGDLYQVVGIAPPSFPGLLPGVAADFWMPLVRAVDVEPAGQINAVHGDPGQTALDRRGYRWMWLKGRLAEGATPAEVEAQVQTVMARLAAEHPVTNEDRTAAVEPLSAVRYHPSIDAVLGPASAILLGAVGLVLVVVCANLASMLLARAEARRREVAIRLSLGASRSRLVRQLLVESLVVAVAGGILALVVARWTTALLAAWTPPLPFSIGLDVGVDGRVLAYTGLVALVSAVLFGLLPARQAARSDLVADIRGSARGRGAKARRFDLRSALVVAQVAVTVVFLVAAALLGRGLLAARALDPGFEPQRVAALGLFLEPHGYSTEEADRFLRELRERAAALPAVADAAVATRVPFDINLHESPIFPDSLEPASDDDGFSFDVTWVDGEYFDTLGVPLLAGRSFTSADRPDSPPVVVINAALARRFWGEPAAAVGRRLWRSGLDTEPYEIVGVAADTKVRSVGEDPRPMVHFSRAQRPTAHGYLLASSRGPDASGVVQELRRLALELDPELAFTETTTLVRFMDVTLYPARMGAVLLAVFGLLALTLASLGLYGVIAYSVSRRRREMGVRFALGAQRAEVIGMVLRGGMKLVAAGAAVGLALAAGAGQLLEAVLYGGSALDPLAFGGALAVLLTVSLAANYVPALRAARTDPATVLEEE